MITKEVLGIARAHEYLVETVYTTGRKIVTEEGELTLESSPISILVKNPIYGNRISSASHFKGKLLEEYTNSILNGTKSTFDYDYHSRLFNDSGNQIDYIIKKIKENPTTRRAVATTWLPQIDSNCMNVPCLQYVQFLFRNEQLDMHVLFRSNDVLSASGANMYALTSLLETVACKLHLKPGYYEHIIISPHLYYRRDSEELKHFIQILQLREKVI